MAVLKTVEFKYGQWDVTIEVKEGFDTVDPAYCTVDCTGNWNATQGILYDYNRECVAYNEPHILPKGLKIKILGRCRRLLAPYYR